MSSDMFLGIAIGFLGNWTLCAVLVAGWIAASSIATRRQRRRGRTGL